MRGERAFELPPLEAEWLEADGLGGFASGTVSGERTRRYHALLLTATTPPTGRFVLVNGCEAWLDTPEGSHPLGVQRYAPDAVYPDGTGLLAGFAAEPWPTWTWRLPGGRTVTQELFAPQGAGLTVLTWRLQGRRSGCRLRVRPFLSGRDAHALHAENRTARADATGSGERVVWQPYPGVPAVASLANADYEHAPLWYRRFFYREEAARGFDAVEDLLSPGTLRWELASGEAATWILGPDLLVPRELDASALYARLRDTERRRRGRFPTRLHRAADAYLVRRGRGRTIVAGYPWFTDWGRDTFVALRGLCLATGRTAEARDILLEWAATVDRGMLPNRFVEEGDLPEFNSVDAALWFIVAAYELGRAAGCRLGRADRGLLEDAVERILEGYAAGTRYGIAMDADGLLRAGEPGTQLTWMDARVGDWTVTPRVGKPVEVQALWLNALRIGAERSPRWRQCLARGQVAFIHRFWNRDAGCLYDTVDLDHVAGTADPSIRPNQIFAVGGLPFPVLLGPRARQVVDVVERRLLTRLGLRSLAPDDPRYIPVYQGDPRMRDAAYHQGTVWPWLLGPFVEAWVRVRGDTEAVRQEARRRFLPALCRHLDEAGLGHVSEIADAEPPHAPRGCPFQAWSVGEALRLDAVVLAQPRRAAVELPA